MEHLKCPECSSKLWKIGFNKFGNQYYRCSSCKKKVLERENTPFYWLHSPDAIVIMGIILYAKYPLSSIQVSEIFNLFGIDVCDSTIRNWVQSCVPHLEKIKKKYKVKFSKIWHVDEKFVPHDRVPSKKYKRGLKKWAYQITVYDSENNVVASFLAPERNSKGIEEALRRARKQSGERPEVVVTDGLQAYDKPVRKVLGKRKRKKHVIAHFEGKPIIHNKKLMILSNNRIERYHSEISPKIRSMRGIKSLEKGDNFFQVSNFIHNFFVKDRIKDVLKDLNLNFSWSGLAELFYKV